MERKHLFVLDGVTIAYKDIMKVERPPADTRMFRFGFIVHLSDGKEIQSEVFHRDEFDQHYNAFLDAWNAYIDDTMGGASRPPRN